MPPTMEFMDGAHDTSDSSGKVGIPPPKPSKQTNKNNDCHQFHQIFVKTSFI